MTLETLHKKTERYLCGVSTPAETRQIQNWLACIPNDRKFLSPSETSSIEQEILKEVQAYTAYPLFFPKKVTWWKKLSTHVNEKLHLIKKVEKILT